MADHPSSRSRKSVSQPPPKNRTISMTSTNHPAEYRTKSFTKQYAFPPSLNTETLPAQAASQPSLRSKRSRTSSLFHLFTKPNVERASGYSEPVPPLPNVPLPQDRSPERPATRMSLRSRSSNHLRFSRDQSPPPTVPERPTSRLSFRRHSITKPAEPKSNSRSGQPRPDATWDPPPLFQAYPQAIKHASLKVPGPTYEPNNQDSVGLTKKQRHSIFGGRSDPTLKKPNREDASVMGRDGWAKKIYVLVTSGHVLEYAGDGPSDRLPDQILRLGKDSAAFASDLIPGFPFVLQVLQTATGGVQVVQFPQKTFLSRIGRRLSSSRRMASNLLLVFDDPEQMDSWMIAIRKEIEALGGKKCRPISTLERATDHSDAMSFSSQRFHSAQRAPSRATIHAASLKSVPSLSTMPTSPAYIAPDRTDSANFTGTDNDWSNSPPYDPLPTDSPRSNVHPLSYSGENISLAHAEQLAARVAVPNQISIPSHTTAPPARIPSQDFSDFYFTDADPQDLSMIHPSERPDPFDIPPLPPKDRRRSTAPSSRRTSGTVSQANFLSEDHAQWQPSQEPDDRTLQLKQHHASTTSREYRPWESNTSIPRFPLGPRVYSRSSTSLQLPTETVEPVAEQSAAGAQDRLGLDHIGLGIDSYGSVNTDTTQSASICSENSMFTETSSLTSKRDSYSLSPFILSQALQQSPTITAHLTSRPYEPRKMMRGAPAPLRIPSRQGWQHAPNSADSPALGRNTPSPSLSNKLRRPASLPVNSDPAPFLSSVAKVKGPRDHQRASIMVPVVRPGTVKSSRKQKADSMLMNLPPARPPPTAPLPRPPGIAV